MHTGLADEKRARAAEASRMEGDALSLDGVWEFTPDPGGVYDVTRVPRGRAIAVPGCWEAQLPEPYGIVRAWYRTSFVVPGEWAGSTLLIRFGAVMYASRVWLNGSFLGAHEGGYTAFSFEAEDAALWGRENVLTVLVENPTNAIAEYPASEDAILAASAASPSLPPAEILHGKQTWYGSTSGIWQSVIVERLPPTRLALLRVLPDATTGSVAVSWNVASQAGGPSELYLGFQVHDPLGRLVVNTSTVDPARSGRASLSLPSIVRWDVDEPNLYEITVTLGSSGGNTHRLTRRFGMRDVAALGGKLLLNGRPIYVAGALDQDLYPDTMIAVPSRGVVEQEMRLARKAGINLLRCHLKVPDPIYLDVADETGILVWVELPSWTRFSEAAAARGEATLEAMLHAVAHHPSVVIFTIVNEDWGTDLHGAPGHRAWLRKTYDWLKRADPTRLVVDNSPAESEGSPGFHVSTDIADLHIYRGMPGRTASWREAVADLADAPAWLWSPGGDSVRTGNEPVVLSEFGPWGLPLARALVDDTGNEQWWTRTGVSFGRPEGVAVRFRESRLGEVWPDYDAMALGTQRLQFEALQFQVAQVRRHESLRGHVVTEWTDTAWEANGLIDFARRPKAFFDRLEEINGQDFVWPDLARRDYWAGDRLECEVVLSAYDGRAERGEIRWRLTVADEQAASGVLDVGRWPLASSLLARLTIPIPAVARPARGMLALEAIDDSGRIRATGSSDFLVLPRPSTAGEPPSEVALADHEAADAFGERVRSLGFAVTDSVERGRVILATRLTDRIARLAATGRTALVVARDSDAIEPDAALDRPFGLRSRRGPVPEYPGPVNPWSGDWITTFCWLRPRFLDGVPFANPLGFEFERIMPEAVLLPVAGEHRDEVAAGIFTGWLHAQAALLWSFDHGLGRISLTTFRLDKDAGAISTALLERLLRQG